MSKKTSRRNASHKKSRHSPARNGRLFAFRAGRIAYPAALCKYSFLSEWLVVY